MNSHEWRALLAMLIAVCVMMCGYGWLMPSSVKERYGPEHFGRLKILGAIGFLFAFLDFLRSG
jgi:hypothetical protein